MIRINEQFAPIIEQDGFETDYINLSGGEKTSIALAYRLALNKVINIMIDSIKTKDIMILDEPTEWNPPKDLLDFLNDGSPPIFIGFGSMSSKNPEETTNLVLRALNETNQRAIMLSMTIFFSIRSLPPTGMRPFWPSRTMIGHAIFGSSTIRW
jgi:hypothetical protein